MKSTGAAWVLTRLEMDGAACAQVLQELTNQVACLVSEAAKEAGQRREGVGNVDRASQKQQMRSLKSSSINLGQKLMFAEAASTWTPGMPHKAEADKAAAAVEHAEDELKDWKNMAKQEEQQLQAGVAAVRSHYATYQAWAARMQSKLEALNRQEALQQQAQATLDALTATGSLSGQGGPTSKLSQETARSTELEAQLGAARATALQDEMSLASEQSHVTVLEAAIRDLQSVEEAEAREQRQEQGCREWSERLALITGVQSVTLDATYDQLQLRLQPHATSGSVQGATYELHVQLQPGIKTQVLSASLTPPALDISGEVKAATACQRDGVPVLAAGVVRLLRERQQGR